MHTLPFCSLQLLDVLTYASKLKPAGIPIVVSEPHTESTRVVGMAVAESETERESVVKQDASAVRALCSARVTCDAS